MEINKDNYNTLLTSCLSEDDLIMFPVITANGITTFIDYWVRPSYLYNIHGTEHYILDYLRETGLITNKREYLESIYGYPSPNPNDGWDDFKTGDYAAITRVVIDIFNKLTNNNIKRIPLSEIKLVL